MLKIGDFSRLSHLTVKALRFYEKEKILIPASVDEWTGYRFYETSQLEDAARIKACRQMDLSIDEIRAIMSGADMMQVLSDKAKALSDQREKIDAILSRIHHILEDKEMKYQVTEKVIPAAIIFYSETVLENYSDIMQWIPSLGEECRKLNPDLRCTEPEYEFCEYPDGEYKEHDIQIRHNQAVTSRGVENDIIRFRDIPETKVLSIYHKGPYDNIGEAYAYIMKYAEDNGYQPTGLTRECYIDGIWNKESVDDWLTEIQLPVR